MWLVLVGNTYSAMVFMHSWRVDICDITEMALIAVFLCRQNKPVNSEISGNNLKMKMGIDSLVGRTGSAMRD